MSLAAERFAHPNPAVWRNNAALAALPIHSLTLLAHKLTRHGVRAGQTLWHEESPPTVYFPLSSIISVALPMQSDDYFAIEVGLVGHEAMVASRAGTHGAALTYGEVASMSAAQFASMAKHDDDIARIAARSSDFLMTQAHHLVICNALHAGHQRCSRWLSQVADRMVICGHDRLLISQKDIGRALGTHRQVILAGMQILVDQGAITHSRGIVRIADHGRLACCACDCYAALSPASWPFREIKKARAG